MLCFDTLFNNLTVVFLLSLIFLQILFKIKEKNYEIKYHKKFKVFFSFSLVVSFISIVLIAFLSVFYILN